MRRFFWEARETLTHEEWEERILGTDYKPRRVMGKLYTLICTPYSKNPWWRFLDMTGAEEFLIKTALRIEEDGPRAMFKNGNAIVMTREDLWNRFVGAIAGVRHQRSETPVRRPRWRIEYLELRRTIVGPNGERTDVGIDTPEPCLLRMVELLNKADPET